MYFLVSRETLEALSKGEKKVDEIATPENVALLDWTGKELVEEFFGVTKDELTLHFANAVAEYLGGDDAPNAEIRASINMAIEEERQKKHKYDVRVHNIQFGGMPEEEICKSHY